VRPDTRYQPRVTRQRREILVCLQGQIGRHKTADEVYDEVRKVIPNISLGTVYRNLEMLSTAGEIRRIELAGMQRRYDGNMAPHDHIRCERCGRIDDVQWRIAECACRAERDSIVTDYEITGRRIEFTGVCARCVRSGSE